MKVQFVFAPPRNKDKLADLIGDVYPPLGILYLAGYLREKLPSIEIKVTDGVFHGWDKTLSEIDDFGPDVLFISYITPCATSAYLLGRQAKELLPGVVTVFGGPHTTCLPMEAFDEKAADFAVVGEGERTSFELLEAISRREKDFSGIDGLCWLGNGKPVRNRPRLFIKDLNEIPFPARDMLDINPYKGWFVHRQTPETSMLSSRGCPFNCTFCTNSVWKSSKPWLRLRSPKNIVDEMESLKASGIMETFDNADEFNCNMPHALAVCEEIKSRNLGMTWKAQVRATPLTDELARAMAEAGCWYVHLGVESGNERTLKGVKKNIDLDQVINACKILKKYGIKIFGLFMLFNAWEENGDFVFEGVSETEKTLDFARNLIDQRLIDYMSCTITTPYPGSQLYEIASRHNMLKPNVANDWSRWLTEESFVMKLPGVTKRDASRMYFRGSLLRGRCILKSGNWGLKDVPLFMNKFIRASLIKLDGLIHRK
jgi:anaerobic magnesium-protoporphyrin IX monomethyl ester cyclase